MRPHKVAETAPPQAVESRPAPAPRTRFGDVALAAARHQARRAVTIATALKSGPSLRRQRGHAPPPAA
ncbi:hypothetical protein HCJ76_03310 [Streptomyces sp. MC1]|uniref:hypothetical protein n=1 Tax=unclassified Streptomyces TaxID=2593676 RepID=UPI0004C820FC|nr:MULTISPECIES: hypothetical protein [unclassified Streptomyces]MBG7697151.1 hypothetical protein [Streptomyces sp. MC1]